MEDTFAVFANASVSALLLSFPHSSSQSRSWSGPNIADPRLSPPAVAADPYPPGPGRFQVSFELESQGIVDGEGQVLFRAEIAFCGLDGGVAEQQLDLFEISACLAA